ncbi:MAG: hypothetical protein LC754_05805 [Acidobacteria bacterium]|nr:hypothetical protein [Acidobacteriota bacterium]
MSKKKTGAATPAVVAVTTVEESPNKAELQRQMEEARESIAETVSEIKDVVSHQYDEVKDKYESVKEGIGEVLDWREQFNENPIVWGAGAVSVGILIGIGLSHAFDDSHTSGRRKKSDVSALGGHLIGEVSGLASAVLPTLTSKVKEMFGVDLAAYLPGADEKKPATRRRGTKKGAASKKSSAKKSGARKKKAQ